MGLSLLPSAPKTVDGATSQTGSPLADQTMAETGRDRRAADATAKPISSNADTMGNPFGELSWDVLEETNDTDHDPVFHPTQETRAIPLRGLPSPQPDVGPAQPLQPLPQHLSIPTPIIQLPDQDLVAGHPVRLTVTLPVPNEIKAMAARTGATRTQSALPLIFVKLWVQDRQTRSILDGPRWLVDFVNNNQGNLESMTQLVLPIGCMEVSVEAIAVELLTQRESNKMTLHRTVSPAALPSHLANFNLDDLN